MLEVRLVIETFSPANLTSFRCLNFREPLSIFQDFPEVDNHRNVNDQDIHGRLWAVGEVSSRLNGVLVSSSTAGF